MIHPCLTIKATLRLTLCLILSMTTAVITGCGGGGGGGGGDEAIQYTLTVQTSGQGNVVTVPAGTAFNSGTTVTLTAVSSTGWQFNGWSGDLSGSSATQVLVMDADKNVTATFVKTVVEDSEAPTWPVGSSADSADIGATFLTLTWDEAQDNVGVSTYRVFRDDVLEDTVTGDKTSLAVTGLSLNTAYSFKVEAGDAAGNWSATGLTHPATTAATLPSDPATDPPDLNTTTVTRMSDATSFLYTGTDAVQKGVVPGSIGEHRVAVIRGAVKDTSDQGIGGVTVSILGMPDLGRTTTRADGAYDIAVNGGAVVKVFFEKEGFLPVKRQVKVPWQNYVRIDDVVMIERDINVKTVTLNSAMDAQIAQGSQESDPDGTRQARLLVPKSVSGELVLADGTRQLLDNMDLRVTEYTVGDDGPKRMPAEMPPNIAYTYAMDLSIDEAMDVNADDVVFDKPLYFYLENFLGFPAGIKVPTGYYDEDRGVWVPSESGLVIKILSDNGATVTVDTDGDGTAEDPSTLTGLGFTDEELTKLAGLYAAGDTLWRVPIDHFSSWDCNFGAYPPDDAKIPWFKPDKKHRPDPCKQAGSIIDTANMALGESVALTGLPFKLYYRSSLMPAYTHTQEIRIWDETVADSLQRILVELEVAGQQHDFEFEKDLMDAFPESFAFTWDGLDAYGREVQGSVPMTVKVGYVYDGVYEANESWGETIADDVTATEIMVDSRQQIGLWNEWTVNIGGLDPRGLGLGGWNLDVHHAYDPNSRTLFRGDGEQRSAEELDPVIITVAGTGQVPQVIYLWNDDGKPATEVDLWLVNDIATGPDGSLYIADPYRGVLRVTPDGLINRITGDLLSGNDAEGIEATQAAVVPLALAIGFDESIYISENDRIRRITPDGLINTIAGDGEAVYGPEGGPAMGAAFEAWKIAVAADGNLYILDMAACVVRKIGTDDRLTVFAGIPNDDPDYLEAYTGEGGRAKAATFYLPMSMALGSDGSVYVGDLGANRVLRISPNGIITTVAGNGTTANEGDGGPAVDAALRFPRSLAMGSDNTLYIGCDGAVRKVAVDGIISTFGGGDAATENEEGVPARQAVLGSIMGLDMGPDKNLYFFEGNTYIKKIATAFGDFNGIGEISIPDKDTQALYVFDAAGRHLRTIDIWSEAVLWEFVYDADGYLWKIRDVDGDETVIEHDLNGNPTAILPPQVESTSLTVDVNGYLEQIIDPEGSTYQFTYSGADGLLTDMTTPNGDAYEFEYYGDGTLKKDSNPAGGSQTLVREALASNNGYKVSVTTEMDRVTTYETTYLDEGGMRIVKTYPNELFKTLLWTPDAGQTIQYVDGTEITLKQGLDPRFGMQMPIPELITEATPGGLIRETRMERDVQLGTITDSISINDELHKLTLEELEKKFTLQTPEERQVTFTLNDEGRISTMQANAMAPVTLVYNDQGKAETVTIGSDRVFQLAYDDDGFLESITDPLLHNVTYERDLAGRVVSKIMHDGRHIDFSYDASGNVVSITPSGRSAHALEYTALNQMSGYDPPDADFSPDSTTFTYNLDGQVTAIHRPGGSSLVFAYDDAGRALSYSHDTYSITAGYDENNGHLTTLTTADGIVHTLTWDGFLMTGDAWVAPGPVTGSVEGEYNNGFRISRLRTCGGPWRNLAYDRDGLLVAAGALSLLRDENGQVTGTSTGTITTAAAYNDFGEQENFSAYAGETLLIGIDYGYDKQGRITDITETVGVDTEVHYQYTYDDTGRLTAVTKDGSPAAGYTYDDNSNRIAYTGSPVDVAVTDYDAQDRMRTYGDASYTYADSGELQRKTVGSDTTLYDYDFVGNLRTVTMPESDGRIIDYLVDGMNRRIGKKIDDTLVQGFVYLDLTRPMAELDENGSVKSEFIYGSRRNVPSIMIRGGVTYRILSDHLGSPRLVVRTSDGTILQRIDYDPFGNPTFVEGSPDFQPFGFAGGLYDSDTGLVRFGVRDYDPETGRWTSKDPILFAGGDSNLYGYVLADPVNFMDPTGYWPNRWLDLIPTSQSFVDRVGAVGDSALEFSTFGLAKGIGKDLRQAVGKDIVNECSQEYKETKDVADKSLNAVSLGMGIGGLKQGITTLLQPGGAAKYFQSASQALEFAGGGANAMQTFSDMYGR